MSEVFTFSSDKLITTSVTVQRHPISPTPAALTILQVFTPRPYLIPEPSDVDYPPFPLPPSFLTKYVARNSNSFKRRKSFDATLCDKPSTSALLTKNDDPALSAVTPNLKRFSYLGSEFCFLLHAKLSLS